MYVIKPMTCVRLTQNVMARIMTMEQFINEILLLTTSIWRVAMATSLLSFVYDGTTILSVPRISLQDMLAILLRLLFAAIY